ncbi:hypothetical protein [Phaffia rhodozyma]|uniref:Uncharacterized protein n=1 Tax=Phaffia rhodozyma TaxID=264483 RepID=A0A0F7ST87_PHARH|nr:hypothetical protein [Phaffia rhodozyma]
MLTFPFVLALLPLACNLFTPVRADKAEIGAACEYAAVHLDVTTYALVTGCVPSAYCSSDNICVARTCRRDEFPYGYAEDAVLPPRCEEGYVCPDEGSGCVAQVGPGETCQVDRDDECSKADDWSDLSSSRNVNGSICLNQACQYQNVTLNSTCQIENLVFIEYTTDGNPVSDIRSRDNCRRGGYCDGTSLTCLRTLNIGESCTADKECSSYNCNADKKCAVQAHSKVTPATWVYVIVALCIVLLIAGTFGTLWYFHKKSRAEHQIMLEQYYTEQVAYRQSLFHLSQTRDSLFSLHKSSNQDSARQTLLVHSSEDDGSSPRDQNDR